MNYSSNWLACPAIKLINLVVIGGAYECEGILTVKVLKVYDQIPIGRSSREYIAEMRASLLTSGIEYQSEADYLSGKPAPQSSYFCK